MTLPLRKFVIVIPYCIASIYPSVRRTRKSIAPQKKCNALNQGIQTGNKRSNTAIDSTWEVCGNILTIPALLSV